MSPEDHEPEARETAPAPDDAGSTGWHWTKGKIAACAFAGILLIGGGLLALTRDGAEPLESHAERTAAAPGAAAPGTGGANSSGPGGAASGFAPGHVPDGTPGDGTPGDEAPAPEGEVGGGGDAGGDGTGISPGLLKGGFSFFVAFAVGFALRMFFRVAALFAGIWAASLFLLAHLGWLEVHWDLIGASFEGWSNTIGAQFESFTAFVNGSLPSAGMAGLGLYTGVRRK